MTLLLFGILLSCFSRSSMAATPATDPIVGTWVLYPFGEKPHQFRRSLILRKRKQGFRLYADGTLEIRAQSHWWCALAPPPFSTQKGSWQLTEAGELELEYTIGEEIVKRTVAFDQPSHWRLWLEETHGITFLGIGSGSVP
ncbi:MAG TPA: hypothetical protein DCE41_33300 [Cytophagales bacterium]|nr:hypothetical protein [Cytophagales bacterium]